MLKVVQQQDSSHNNDERIAKSQTLSKVKYFYYCIFAHAYSYVGRFAGLVMVNGTWTHNHIKDLWRCHPRIVFPPCDTKELLVIIDA